jgi:GR25 family glycosyltransferase involved in LPS biosynthesis
MLKNVYVLTLEHRFDRQINVQDELKKHNINFEFFYGINGHECDYKGNLLKGEWGVQQSHLKILKMAIEKRLEYICIFEDDVQLATNFDQNFEVPLDFDLFYFGGMHKEPIQFVRDNIYSVSNTVCLHAVLIRNTVYESLIESICSNPEKPVDDSYALIQKNVNAYCVHPPVAWQKENYSDIQNKFVKYDWLKPQ